jgi:hypothetical protein
MPRTYIPTPRCIECGRWNDPKGGPDAHSGGCSQTGNVYPGYVPPTPEAEAEAQAALRILDPLRAGYELIDKDVWAYAPEHPVADRLTTTRATFERILLGR